MSYIIQIVITLLTLYIAEATRKLPEPPKIPGLEEFQFPTVDATRKYPVIWGRPVVKGPNLTWYGDLWTTNITKKIKGLFKSKRQTVGYKFYLGLFMCLGYSRGGANTRLLKVIVGDQVVWTGSITSGSGHIDKETAFGGEESEGGVSGDFNFWPGGPTQGQDSYLSAATRLGPRVPAYRSSIRFVWRCGYLGTSKYPKDWAFQIECLPAGLNSGFHSIDGEANPAEIFYEMLTHPLFGLNESTVNINIPSFLVAASQLHAEGFGLSLVWDGSKPLGEIRKDIEKHIDGALYRNVQTGKWEMTLNRRLSDAAISALPIFNRDNCRIVSFSRPTADELVNELYVNWTEGGEASKLPVRAKNLAALDFQSHQPVSATVNYYGVTKYELADKLAWRDMAALGTPLDRVTLEINRGGHVLKPYSKFRLEWDDSLPQLADSYVVVDIDYGTLDDNTVSVEAIQDLFDLGPSFNIGGSGSQWEEISRDPIVPTNYRMEFTPYWLLRIQEDVASPESAAPMLLVQAPSPGHLEYQVLYADPSTNSSFAAAEDAQPFTPTARLAYDFLPGTFLSSDDTLIVDTLTSIDYPPVGSSVDLRNLGTGLILIDNELMGITQVTTLQSGGAGSGKYALRVQRALLDSAMAPHYAGATVWFISAGMGRTPSLFYPWQTGTYQAKLLPVTIGGILPEASAPVASISSPNLTTNVRPLWAYPVRRLRIGTGEGSVVVPQANLTVTWLNSNRAAETSIVFHGDGVNNPIEPDVVYRVYLYNAAGILLANSVDLTGTSYTFLLGTLPGQALPQTGYVQVEAFRTGYGSGARATIWFTLEAAAQPLADGAVQSLLDASNPSSFWRLED